MYLLGLCPAPVTRRGMMISVLVVILGLAPRTDAANGSVVYTYDALGRLVTASYDTGVCIAYSYDANGNRTSQKILVASPGGPAIWGCFNWGNALWTQSP
jgi:YD repeat-containing protein